MHLKVCYKTSTYKCRRNHFTYFSHKADMAFSKKKTIAINTFKYSKIKITSTLLYPKYYVVLFRTNFRKYIQISAKKNPSKRNPMQIYTVLKLSSPKKTCLSHLVPLVLFMPYKNEVLEILDFLTPLH